MITQTRGRRSAEPGAAWRDPCPWSSPVYYRITSPSSVRPSVRSHWRDNSLLFRYSIFSLVVIFYYVSFVSLTIFLQVHFFCKHVHVHCASMYYPCFKLFTVFYIDTRYPKHALCIHVPWYSKICYTFIADYKTSRPTLQCNIDLHMYKYMYLQWIQYNR